ncbi:MAG: trimethylamine methyltransferase family protein [SAR324 cluster bacterium]|nr:trimethylamine methyltransferase family protein [SAR324 cluster bacterium]
MKQFTEYLTNDEVIRVHEASLEVLEDVGVKVRHERAKEIFLKHGCIEKDDHLVKIPAKVVDEFMQMTIPTFTFRGRDPEFDKTIPQDSPVVITGSSAPNLIDPKTGEHRRATSEDIANIAFLINELPGIDVFSISTLADDAPQGQFSLSRFYPAAKNCKKPIRGNTPSISDLKMVLKLGEIIAGSKAAYEAQPFFTLHCCPIISPLTYDFDSTELIIYTTENNIPSYPTIVPNGGMASPLSLLGSLVQANAEFLSLTVLRMMIKPGAPHIYATLPVISDMRSGDYPPGAIETGILHAAHNQMARYYNLPAGGYIGLTGAHTCDAQSGYETGMSTMVGLLGGTDMFNMAGLLGALMEFDFGKLAIDSEISEMLKKTKSGFRFDEDELCIDVIKEVGPGGTFIDKMHTFENMKDAAFLPKIATREMRDTWKEKGSKDVRTRAMELINEILSLPNYSAISQEVDRQIKQTFPGIVKGDSVW